MLDHIAYFNGEYIPYKNCKLSMNDRGFRSGDAVFDVERTFNGKIWKLRAHLERLYKSLKQIQIDPGLSLPEMEHISNEVVKLNEPLRGKDGDFKVRQLVTRGSGASILNKTQPTICVNVEPINFGKFSNLYSNGCKIIFTRVQSYNPNALNPNIKHQSRMNFVLAELEAASIDPDAWPVLLDEYGYISEGTWFNFWIVKDGVLMTPNDRSILKGVSGDYVRYLARQLGILVSKGNISPSDAYNADEAFITGTTFCLLPVSHMDSHPTKGKIPGKTVETLLNAWSRNIKIDITGQSRKNGGR